MEEAYLYYENFGPNKKSHEYLDYALKLDAYYRQLEEPGVYSIAYPNKPEPGTKKPYIPELEYLHFSISHSEDLWMCVTAPFEIGLDIQRKRKVNVMRMAKRFFHPEEATWLEANGEKHFVRVWVLKEAYLKYTGEGITRGMEFFSVLPTLENPVYADDSHETTWMIDGVATDLQVYEEKLEDGGALAMVSDRAYHVEWRGF